MDRGKMEAGIRLFVEGIGERLTEIDWPRQHAAVIWPQVHVSTAEIFSAPELTRSTKALRIADFSALRDNAARNVDMPPPLLFGTNDLEPVARRRYPLIGAALDHLGRHGAARMTGSGSAVFALLPSREAAQQAVEMLPTAWAGWAVETLEEAPLAAWL